MKKKRLFIATLLVVAAVSAAVVSCKKESPNTLMSNTPQNVERFTPPQVADMNAYLKDFKAKMQNVTRDGNETLSLEEAAWHLACLANFDFCRINVEYDDVLFDTIEMQVNVTNGTMLMSDLNLAYDQMCTEIQQFKKGFNFNNQNLYFANIFINGNGTAKIALMTSFLTASKNINDHLWYFPDTYAYIDSVCEYHFNSSAQYVWNGYAKTELQRILNLFEHHECGTINSFFIPTRNHSFNYPNYLDPYGNTFTGDSRVFAFDVSIGAVIKLSPDEMCYCLDSYLGLGYDFISNSIYEDEHPVNWIITDTIISFQQHKFPTHMHILTVQYGQILNGGLDPNPND